MIRQVGSFLVVLALLTAAACSSPFPTAPEIDAALNSAIEDEMRSVGGPWYASAGVSGSTRLVYALSQAPDGRLQGEGTFMEAGGPAMPITVAGTYRRPSVSLTFSGIVYQGRNVNASLDFTNAAFAANGALKLVADGYATSLTVQIFRGAPPRPSLQGRVTDAVSGAAVQGATISVQGTSVTSSATGHYVVGPESLVEGRHPISVMHPLYQELVQTIDMYSFRIVDFKLQPRQ